LKKLSRFVYNDKSSQEISSFSKKPYAKFPLSGSYPDPGGRDHLSAELLLQNLIHNISDNLLFLIIVYSIAALLMALMNGVRSISAYTLNRNRYSRSP